jgi:phytoene synthase
MQLEHAWEHSLLTLACEPLHRSDERAAGEAAHHAADQLAAYDAATLAHAYDYCESITAVNSRSFHLASRLLPPQQRAAVRALYAFCRVSDDIVDRAAASLSPARGAQLESWRRLATAQHPPASEPVAMAWAHARRRYSVPSRYAEQLIDGVGRDLHQTRYQTFDELATYCYGVASTVGLMSMHIIGFQGAEAIPYAIKLGVALQMTNILRDVGEDWRLGRVYLPQAELDAFGLDETDLGRARVTPQWRQFMRFQIERNRRLYAESLPGLALLHPEGRFAIAAAAHLYSGILTAIERMDYDVFTQRAYVGKWGKLRMLPGVWWRSRQAGG